MSDLISVIVPIYNVEPYLDKCISSICNQTYNNLEIILVDDGSTDKSGDICDIYAKKDNRIVVIHQPNGKITKARKAGINASLGKYVGFVDGDDWIESDMYTTLISEAKKNDADIVMSGMWRDKDGVPYTRWFASERFKSGIYRGKSLDELKRFTLSAINGSLCNKVIKTDILREEINYISDDLYGIEDDIVTHMCILRTKKVVIVDDAFYHGVERMDSATHSKHDDYYLMLHRALVAYKHMKDIFKDKEFHEEVKKTIASKIIAGVGHITEGYCLASYIISPDINVKENDKVVLYGGGAVGESYYKQLSMVKGIKIKWVDGYRTQSVYTNNYLCKIEDVNMNNYNMVIIAMKKRGSNIKDIMNKLVRCGVQQDIIWWRDPVSIIEA